MTCDPHLNVLEFPSGLQLLCRLLLCPHPPLLGRHRSAAPVWVWRLSILTLTGDISSHFAAFRETHTLALFCWPLTNEATRQPKLPVWCCVYRMFPSRVRHATSVRPQQHHQLSKIMQAATLTRDKICRSCAAQGFRAPIHASQAVMMLTMRRLPWWCSAWQQLRLCCAPAAGGSALA